MKKRATSAAICTYLAINLSPPAATAQTASATYNGITYEVYSRADFYPKNKQEAPWLGDPALAEALAKAFNTQLGMTSGERKAFPDNIPDNGPSFTYDVQAPLNPSRGDAIGWEWSGLYNKQVQENHSINTLTGSTTSSLSPYGATINFAILSRSYASSSPITPSGNATNGSGNNKTSNLGLSLLPQFEGGTLTVDQGNSTITQDFTLSSSSTNAIDINGLVSTFSGSFSDAAGDQGTIEFKNNKSGGHLNLSGKSTYKGATFIRNGADVTLGIDNALPATTDLLLEFGAVFNLNNKGQEVAAIGGGSGTIKLGSGTLKLGGTGLNNFNRTSNAQISGTGSLIKGGAYYQILRGISTFTGSTSIQGGTLALASDGSISQSRLIGVDQGATFISAALHLVPLSRDSAGQVL